MATMEIIRKRKRIKMRFRGIVRVVLCRNIAQPELRDKYFTNTLKQNITTFMRRQNKFSMLTRVERTILSKPYWMRTVEEKRQLVKLYATLDCFSSYPPKVRARMAPHLHYMRAETGRTLIKAGHRPKTVYFILNGEILYTKKVYDPIKDEIIEKNMYLAGPGDVVGISAFIVEMNRDRTILVLSTVEALYMDSDNFLDTLYPTVKTQYNQKIYALSKFDILNFFDRNQSLYAIQYGILKRFEQMETIYCLDDKGEKYVYFILSGQCMILQSLEVQAKKVPPNKKIYKLIQRDEVEVTDQTEEVIDLINKSDNYLAHQEKKNQKDELDLGKEDEEKEESNIKIDSKGQFASACPIEETEVQRRVSNKYQTSRKKSAHSESSEDQSSEGSERTEATKITEEIIDHKKAAENEWKTETHFIDVGTLSFGAIFGLGEVMTRRAIMARSVVQCYLLPRHWLYEKPQNPGNIWQQIRFNLDSTIPSENKLYEDFLATQKWEKIKSDYINSLLTPENLTSKIQDIPAYCRVIESSGNNDD